MLCNSAFLGATVCISQWQSYFCNTRAELHFLSLSVLSDIAREINYQKCNIWHKIQMKQKHQNFTLRCVKTEIHVLYSYMFQSIACILVQWEFSKGVVASGVLSGFWLIDLISNIRAFKWNIYSAHNQVRRCWGERKITLVEFSHCLSPTLTRH